ncbi:hypothetical protein M2093_001042 [Breznakia sp. PH1-1]|nr:hypothetical protein [Breznakia sp. PH1-1]MDH6404073.1 hypothetical protein [Breznakia sp. PF1-11]MDH6411705.1 hypothetical protein [Breznakia sp. PFB1-11]MDH6414061.1 hypothetical protein [Breznakia sp. PFB1-14]MDH6416491.1 hypothetical protein [Breznakia sp. PFB1-4]MDH6418814.1 hypothetical protein [Breznakia sp. PFB1-12]MDH6473767.1 hypothetical protein [Breznakia sp. PFB2-30]MDH6476280.1 hypothetical protein [Breznakia sp. PFB1-19]
MLLLKNLVILKPIPAPEMEAGFIKEETDILV